MLDGYNYIFNLCNTTIRIPCLRVNNIYCDSLTLLIDSTTQCFGSWESYRNQTLIICIQGDENAGNGGSYELKYYRTPFR